MTTATMNVKTQVLELSDEALRVFCDDASEMFGTGIAFARREATVVPASDFRSHFRDLAVVHLVKAEGSLEGTFHLVFDQSGLFILSGLMVMLPRRRILEELESGSEDDAVTHRDAAREVGNLLVDAWDRVFRQGFEGHRHFVKGLTAVGKPLDQLDRIGLSDSGEILLACYTMTVGTYPSFTFAIALPAALLGDISDGDLALEGDEADASLDALDTPFDGAELPSEEPPSFVSTPQTGQQDPVQRPAEPRSEEPSPFGSVAQTSQHDSVQRPAEPRSEKPSSVGSVAQTGQHDSVQRPKEDDSEVSADEAATALDAEAIFDLSNMPVPVDESEEPGSSGSTVVDPQHVKAAASLPNDAVMELLQTPASEVMRREVVWSGPDDTVKDVIARMQQHNTGYALIGQEGVLEGLVSGSNVAAAVSLYLRPMFAKYRRAQDDATLGVKVKWIMSHPVRTISPDTSVATIVENMCRYGGRCLPVVDGHGNVLGIVTALDLLLHFLKGDDSSTWQGRPPRTLPLLI